MKRQHHEEIALLPFAIPVLVWAWAKLAGKVRKGIK